MVNKSLCIIVDGLKIGRESDLQQKNYLLSKILSQRQKKISRPTWVTISHVFTTIFKKIYIYKINSLLH